ncbi:hypothetical protein AURDEDRAFT_111584 [Auricularia subglabra TFB-10046 SS5]|nr:hypothetical protein AURDEDRAFT_111584 [Auricularia subglabra TFB-10046 SS5]
MTTAAVCIRGARSYPPPVSCHRTTTIMAQTAPAPPLDPRVRRIRAGEGRTSVVECENRAEARFQLQGPGALQFNHTHQSQPRFRPRRFQEVVVPDDDDGDDAMDEDAPPVSRSVSDLVNAIETGDDAEMSECPSPAESDEPLTPASSSSGSPQSMSMELDAPANSFFGAVGASANRTLITSRAPALFPPCAVRNKRKIDVCDDLFAAQPLAKRVIITRANTHPFAAPSPRRDHFGLYVATTAAVSFAQ